VWQGPGHVGRSSGARAVPPARRSLLGQALPPVAESGRGQVAGRGDSRDVVACHPPRTDGLCTAQAAGLLGVLQDGLAGGQRIIATGAFEGAQRLAPWRSMTSLPDVSLGDSLLIGAKPLRFTFSRFY
jgi:hypothetical protein